MKPYATALFLLTFLLTAYNFSSFGLYTTSVDVTILDPVTVSVITAPQAPNTGSNMKIFATAVGGDPSHKYVWRIDWGNGVVNTVSWDLFPDGLATMEWLSRYEMGTYTITVTATDWLGNSGSAKVVVQIGSTTPVESSCNVSPKIGVRPVDITVNCIGKGGSGYYNWGVSWGDESQQENSVTPSGSVSRPHTYTKAGSFTIKVTTQESNTAYCTNNVCPLSVWQASFGVADYSQPPPTSAPTPQPSAKPNWSDPLILLNLVMVVTSVVAYTRGRRSV